MKYIKRSLRTLAVLAAAVLCLGTLAGCCNRKKSSKKINDSIKIEDFNLRNLSNKDTGHARHSPDRRNNEYLTGDPEIDESRKRKAEQYKRLEYAYKMLKDSNPQGALREIERLQMNIRNDPYLEMQAWYLSAMIYHRMGKPSRRKRSMRKMLETMEQLQKDPRFMAAYNEGMDAQEVVKMAIKEGEKYAE
ncbi:MAG: hypothetical protein Kow0029_14100 [Candidatus Rifleibacteriota bacterium]